MSLFSKLAHWGRGQKLQFCQSFSGTEHRGGEKMKKKIMLISIMLLALLIVSAIPAYAKPTNGPNKVAVTVDMTRDRADPADGGDGGGNGILLEGPVVTGQIIHVVLEQHFFITITFDDDSTLEGYAVVYRKVVNIKVGARVVLTDNYVFTFDLDDDEVADAGFEGNGLVMLNNVDQLSKAYGIFHGTGDFEGQTLNIGHGWINYISEVNSWYGYWLKCPEAIYTPPAP